MPPTVASLPRANASAWLAHGIDRGFGGTLRHGSLAGDMRDDISPVHSLAPYLRSLVQAVRAPVAGAPQPCARSLIATAPRVNRPVTSGSPRTVRTWSSTVSVAAAENVRGRAWPPLIITGETETTP